MPMFNRSNEPIGMARHASAEAAPARLRLLGLSIFGLGAGMALLSITTGQYFHITKGMVLPGLALAAALSGRGLAALRDWLLFLVLLLLFDTLRGSIFVAIFAWHLPWYAGYVLELEQLVFGTPSLPHWLQAHWPALLASETLRVSAVLVHASHFVYFLGFGWLVYATRRQVFGEFQIAMILAMFVGLLGYLLVPTVPPWMAANLLGLLPPIERVVDGVYTLYIPRVFEGFHINPIAAMPSLHAAFPTVCAVVGWRLYRWAALPLVLYAALAMLAAVYLAEHYGVDVLAGIGVGLVACGIARRAAKAAPQPVPEPLRRAKGRDPRALVEALGRRRVAVSLFAFLLAMALGLTNRSAQIPMAAPDRGFVEREIVGRSDLLPLFTAADALRRERLQEARPLIAEALATPAAGSPHFLGDLLLYHSAGTVAALELVVAALESRRGDDANRWRRNVIEVARRRIAAARTADPPSN